MKILRCSSDINYRGLFELFTLGCPKGVQIMFKSGRFIDFMSYWQYVFQFVAKKTFTLQVKNGCESLPVASTGMHWYRRLV